MLVSGLLSGESQPQNCCTIKAVSRSTHRISLGFLVLAVQLVTLTNSKKRKTSTNSQKNHHHSHPLPPKPKPKIQTSHFRRVSFRLSFHRFLSRGHCLGMNLKCFSLPDDFFFPGLLEGPIWCLYKLSRRSQPLYWLRCYLFLPVLNFKRKIGGTARFPHLGMFPFSLFSLLFGSSSTWVGFLVKCFSFPSSKRNHTVENLTCWTPTWRFWMMIFLLNWVIF